MSEAEVTQSSLIQYALARAHLYELLARLYASEPDGEFLRRMRDPSFADALRGIALDLDEDFFSRPLGELEEELAVEYARLFLGPNEHISPHESVHREGEGFLWGESTVKVRAFVESSGLRYCSDFTGIPDHISVELEFMHKLAEAEAHTRERHDEPGTERLREMQKNFLNEHLLQWIPQFADRIIETSTIDFYRKTARLLKKFVVLEANEASAPERK